MTILGILLSFLAINNYQTFTQIYVFLFNIINALLFKYTNEIVWFTIFFVYCIIFLFWTFQTDFYLWMSSSFLSFNLFILWKTQFYEEIYLFCYINIRLSGNLPDIKYPAKYVSCQICIRPNMYPAQPYLIYFKTFWSYHD